MSGRIGDAARIEMVMAVAANGVMGRGGRLPWRLPTDLRRFGRVTAGCPIVMGSRTWDSIGRPLPGRRSIVMSRRAVALPQDVRRAASLEEALAAAGDVPRVMIVGGRDVYRLFEPLAVRIYLTEVLLRPEGDVRYAPPRGGAWIASSSRSASPGPGDDAAMRFVVLDRAPNGGPLRGEGR